MQTRALDPNLSSIFLFPSEATVAIIQTDPVLNITCLVPPKKRDIRVDYYGDTNIEGPTVVQTQLDTPHLLWTQMFMRWVTPHLINFACGCFKCSFKQSTELKFRGYKSSSNFYRFFVHAIDLEKSSDNSIIAAPYTVANNDNGYVCWGGIPYPNSLRKAHADYWCSVHNNSPGKYPVRTSGFTSKKASEDLAKFMQEYKPISWNNFSALILGQKYVFSSEPPDGIIISLDPQLSAAYPEVVQKEAFVGFAHQSGDGWIIKNKNIEFSIDNSITPC